MTPTPSDDVQQPISDEDRATHRAWNASPGGSRMANGAIIAAYDARLTAETEARRAAEKRANGLHLSCVSLNAQVTEAEKERDDLSARLAEAERAEPETITDIQDAVRGHLIGWLKRLGLESYIDGSGSDGGCVDLTESELSQATGRVDEMVGVLKDARDVAIRDREGCRGQNLVYHQEKLATESREQAALAKVGKLRGLLAHGLLALNGFTVPKHELRRVKLATETADMIRAALAANPEGPK